MTDLTTRRPDASRRPSVPDTGGDDLIPLLQQAAAGEVEAFAELYDRTSKVCFGLAMRVVRDESAAEEITRDAYLHLWTHSVRYDPAEGSPMAWIAGLVHRRAVEHARFRMPPSNGVAAEDQAGAASPVDARECLELAYFEGRTWSEVARAEHIDPVAAAVQIRDGLREL